MFWPRGIGFQFSPQLSDVDSQVLRLLRAVRPPNFVQELTLCEHFAGMADEHLKQLVFVGSQVDILVIHLHKPLLQVQLHEAESKYRSSFRSDCGGPAKSCPNAREQLTDSKRLGDIVVGSHIESRDFIPLLASRRENYNRDLTPLAHTADYFEAV